jgi:hypothetical protein
MADRAKFLDFLDMIDGGGAGQRGNQFEGGGIFSMLANLMPINPYGSEDKVRREARDAFFAEQGITPQQAAATPAVIRALQYDAGPITQDMRPRGRTFPQSNQFIPEMPVMPQRSFPNNAPPSVAQSAPAQGMPDMSMKPMAGVTTPMPVRDPNAELARFNQMMETIPMELRSTISQQMYRDYLLGGGTAAFPDYMKGM